MPLGNRPWGLAAIALATVLAVATVRDVARRRAAMPSPVPSASAPLSPTRLAIASAEVSLGDLHDPTPEPEPSPPADFRAVPTPDSPSAWGRTVRLSRRDAAGAWQPIGEGFDGILGASFDLAADGRTLWLGDEAHSELVKLTLATGAREPFVTPARPELVALAPAGPERVAYSVETDPGDALYLLENRVSRRLYPPETSRGLPWLGFAWAPDGRSLVAYWEERPEKEGPQTQVVWLRPDGRVGLEASLEQAVADFAPLWVPAPDGRRMGLALGPGAWSWADGEPEAAPIEAAAGEWGFSPDGSLIAGLDDRTFYVTRPGDNPPRLQHELKDLPAGFLPRPGSLVWRVEDGRDRVSFTGELPAPRGQVRDATIAVVLSRP